MPTKKLLSKITDQTTVKESIQIFKEAQELAEDCYETSMHYAKQTQNRNLLDNSFNRYNEAEDLKEKLEEAIELDKWLNKH